MARELAGLRATLRQVLGLFVSRLTSRQSATTGRSVTRSTTGSEPRGDEGTAIDKLIDGETIGVTDSSGVEVGYVMGWPSSKIPPEFRPFLWTQAARLELEAWRDIIRDERRPVPGDVTLIIWEDLPLAVWIPAGHITQFNFSPN